MKKLVNKWYEDPVYIKQCEKATEIQKQKWYLSRGKRVPWEDGDMISLYGEVFMYDGCSHSEGFIEPDIYNKDCVWLPRQDQLQEIYYDFTKLKVLYAGRVFYNWFENQIDENEYNDEVSYPKFRTNFTSMEQLWLAFCMHELYSKKWNGEDWVKEE